MRKRQLKKLYKSIQAKDEQYWFDWHLGIAKPIKLSPAEQKVERAHKDRAAAALKIFMERNC